MILKERHRHLDSRAPKAGSAKVEDVKRHVFKVCMSPTTHTFYPTASYHLIKLYHSFHAVIARPDDEVTLFTGSEHELTKSTIFS